MAKTAVFRRLFNTSGLGSLADVPSQLALMMAIARVHRGQGSNVAPAVWVAGIAPAVTVSSCRSLSLSAAEAPLAQTTKPVTPAIENSLVNIGSASFDWKLLIQILIDGCVADPGQQHNSNRITR
jgi:hypothetical protein